MESKNLTGKVTFEQRLKSAWEWVMWLHEGRACQSEGTARVKACSKNHRESNVPKWQISISGRVVGDTVREVAGDWRQTPGHLMDHCTDLGFCSKRNGVPLEGSGHRSDVIWFFTLKQSFWLLGGISSWETGKSRIKKTSWDASAKGEMVLT